jgi:hypothetical protein
VSTKTAKVDTATAETPKPKKAAKPKVAVVEQATVVSVRGMVRDMACDYATTTNVEPPKAWTDGDDRPAGRKVTVNASTATEVAQFLVDAREWARLAGTFKDATRRANLLRDTLTIAKKFADVGGTALDVPERVTLRENSTQQLPTEPVTDLAVGDEILVVRHLTRYGLDVVERFPAVVKGTAKNGDYWLTSLTDGTARACRQTEVVVVKRATQVTDADTDPKKRTRVKK